MSKTGPQKNIASITGRSLFISIILVLALSIFSLTQISAFDYPKLLSRSLTIGTTEPGATTDYSISWRYPTSSSVGSIRLVLCSDGFVLDPCSNTPPGNLSGAILASQSGALSGFSISSQAANEIVLSRVASGATGTGQYTYAFDNVVNPTGVQDAFFIQIFTYASTDASGSPNHISSVTNATAEPIVINTEVPPILYFCAALTIDEWCENVNGNQIDYGDLTPVIEDTAISQFGVATNAPGGYVVTANGDSMTAGNRVIPALSTPLPNTPGEAQFGLNLRANTNPAMGQDVFGEGIGTVSAGYDNPDLFQYADGDVVASAVTGSLFNTYTVTYIVNVPPDQPSGVYNTTIAYICTAAF